MDVHNNAWDWSVLGFPSPLITEDVLNFSSPPTQPPIAAFEEPNASDGKSDVFAEWMDEKIDLSILDGLEGQPDILDDLDAMVGDPVALLDTLMDWSSELLGSGSEITNTKKSSPLKEDMLQVTGLSPPVSPTNKVPDVSFAVLPEFIQDSLYRQSSVVSSSPVGTTTVIPDDVLDKTDEFNPLDYLKVEFDTLDKIDLGKCTPSSPPLTPISFVPNANNYLKVEVFSPNTELDSCISSTPPLTPTPLVSCVEYVATENATEVETIASIEVPDSCSSFTIDSPFNCKGSDSESNETSDVSVKEYNSGNMSLPTEFKADIKSDLQTKKIRFRKKIVPTSDPPLPVETRRKERKRVQNKDAATRYREKKRKESQAVMDEELTLEKRNKELNSTVNKLASEISYLKGLLKEAKLRAQSRQKLSSNFSSPVTV